MIPNSTDKVIREWYQNNRQTYMIIALVMVLAFVLKQKYPLSFPGDWLRKGRKEVSYSNKFERKAFPLIEHTYMGRLRNRLSVSIIFLRTGIFFSKSFWKIGLLFQRDFVPTCPSRPLTNNPSYYIEHIY